MIVTPLPAIELYSIGTELLMGQIQDTNTYWMARQIARIGGYVRRMAILDDRIDEIVGVLSDAVSRRTRIVVTTGGLGPTDDDLTVDAVARLLGVRIVAHEPLVEAFMQRRGVACRGDLRPGLIKMASVPEGARVHPNPVGAAPGVEAQIGGTTVFNLPGPPREMEALFTQSVEGAIASLYRGNRASLRVAVNLPESELGPLLHRVMQDHPDTYLKAYVALRQQVGNGQRLPVDIVARAEDEHAAGALLNAALAAFRNLVEEKGQDVVVLAE